MAKSDIERTNSSNLKKNGITKPSIELDDFFAYLDPKVVEKIKQTSEEDRARIVDGVRQYEYELDGAENIIKSLG